MARRPAPRRSKPDRLARAQADVRAWLARGDHRTRRLKLASLVFGIPAAIGFTIAAILWVHDSRLIDRRLGGEQRPIPRIFARPYELRAGEALSALQLEQRLNESGYAKRPQPEQPGQFALADNSVYLIPRVSGQEQPRVVRVEFSRGAGPVITRLTALPPGTPAPSLVAPVPAPAKKSAAKGGTRRAAGPTWRPVQRVLLEAPMLTALAPGEKRRYTPLSSIPKSMIDAVVIIEDRRFFDHPGVDPIGAVGALVTNIRGTKPYLVGGSTITQQIIKNTFLTPAKTYTRKLREQFMALVLESRFTKEQILELYLNEVVLGQRGPFEIHGVSEAARIFFGKDVRNLTLAESAGIAGLIQSPSSLSPFRHPDRARTRRNVVLKEMADAGMVSAEDAAKAAAEPFKITPRALENAAPYFVDFVSRQVNEDYAGLLKKGTAVDVYTTLDVQMQRMAQEAVAEGIVQVDKQLAARKRKGPAEAALVAVDPRTGDILAFVGGRAYNQSQYNRVVAARRQPGSTFKPFVYLAAFEKMADEGRADLTPATVMIDEPTTFYDDTGKEYSPSNYQNEYAGPVTLRDALAHSRNVVSIKVAEQTGYDRVAALWKRVGAGTAARPYPSIALGVFEATPLEMATAYTAFLNGGAVRPLQSVTRISQDGKSRDVPREKLKTIARPSSTYLVVNMMRSVLNGGTAGSARSAGFLHDAAGKTGTTNDQRDAWFIGFTPELLTVVWVGLDNNQPLGLSGGQAALPIWTSFMKRALAGRPNNTFDVPSDVVFADIDRNTGQLATPYCPSVMQESFLAGTEPRDRCALHGVNPIREFFGRIFR